MAVAAVVPVPLQAELNVPIAVRVVSFLQPPPSGTMPAAIVFSPGNPASIADAAAIERAIGGGSIAGKAVLRPRRVPATALESLAGYRVAFVAAGTRADQDAIAAAASRASVVTITSDEACVQAARCVVGIASGARVQITVNRAAARAANARFGSAFLMLVKEI
ncbi:YfiR/HmsC family protein [Sphingomonas sp. BK235]|uniref:YfiR/HmsC family protein n=1 Tax=Sphingomonas sp. BK235 TaxID=2512131 RepID=UPI001FB590D0|nr:YfiR/HmsC family protein [Sphingomonas sp. BK235]